MDYRDELDRMAHLHGYEEREDDPPCSECIHFEMCSGKNCKFERRYTEDDLIPRYYHVNDWESRLDSKLLNEKDMDDIAKEWPSGLEGPFFTRKSEWEKSHPARTYRIRVTQEIEVEARDELEAYDLVHAEFPASKHIETDVLYDYRMRVDYENGESGFKYAYAANPREAQYKLLEQSIGEKPYPNDIETKDEEAGEWYATWVRRIEEI